MVPLKPWITGQRTPPSRDLVSCQKCFRGAGLKYDDIASVGDPTHHTFFEMLGNWSIGHYFKEGAIDYAWEFSTEVLGLDPDRLWPSIYPDDAESERLWVEKIGVPRERISRLTENWWAAGPTGPCGYDSELYFDWGGPCSCGRTDCTPQDECGGDRWEEFWNLVFMEFDQQPDGSRPLLPNPTVDTGLGLRPDRRDRPGRPHRVRHRPLRADGRRLPVARRRRGLRPGLRALALRARRPPPWRRLPDRRRGASGKRGARLRAAPADPARRRARAPRRRCEGGLAAGTRRPRRRHGPGLPGARRVPRPDRGDARASRRRRSPEPSTRAPSGSRRCSSRNPSRIDGVDAFRLYDTFGLPIELTVEMAAERGATVDLEGFESAMHEQRERGQASARRVGFAGADALPPTRFVGYDSLEAEATVLRIGLDRRDRGARRRRERRRAPRCLAVLRGSRRPGGRHRDAARGRAAAPSCATPSRSPAATPARTTCSCETGELRAGQPVHARVDAERRGRIARHHSATHLLNRALREVLGDGVVQRGSFVGPDHTTFDFSFSQGAHPRRARRHRASRQRRHPAQPRADAWRSCRSPTRARAARSR